MDYVEKINLENKRKLQGLLKELPKFCGDFFRYLDTRNTASRTRLSYGYDIRIFFEFIQENNPVYARMPMHDIPISVLDEMTRKRLEKSWLDARQTFTPYIRTGNRGFLDPVPGKSYTLVIGMEDVSRNRTVVRIPLTSK